MARARPKNWSVFQHYRDRSPPWIKLHRSLLDDYEFQSLPLASRALAPMLWLIASETDEGWFELDYAKLAFRLRCSADEVASGVDPLVAKGFLEVEHGSASGTLAKVERSASPEKKRRELETEGEEKRARRAASKLPDDCPTSEDRKAAATYWRDRGREDLCARLDDEVTAFRAHHAAHGKRMVDWPAAWRTWYGNAVKFNKKPNGLFQPKLAGSDTAETPDERMERFVRTFKERQVWLDRESAPPDSPDCCAPEHLLVKYGFRSAA